MKKKGRAVTRKSAPATKSFIESHLKTCTMSFGTRFLSPSARLMVNEATMIDHSPRVERRRRVFEYVEEEGFRFGQGNPSEGTGAPL